MGKFFNKKKKIIIIVSSLTIIIFTTILLIIYHNNLNLLSNYQTEIILKTDYYLEKENINLENLKDNESIDIDTKKIIKSKKYKNCNGTLTIIKYKESYDYETNVNCNNKESNDLNYKVYAGNINNTIITDDGIFITSNVDVTSNIVDNISIIKKSNLLITLLDKDSGKVIWKTVYDKFKSKKNYIIKVKDIKRLNDTYIVLVNIFYDEKNSSNLILKYSLDGKLKDTISNFETKNYLINELTPIGTLENNIYYMGSYFKKNTKQNFKCVLSVSENSYSLMSFDSIQKLSSKKFDFLTIDNNYFYGIANSSSIDSKNGIILTKFDMMGNNVKEETILNDNYILEDKFIVTNNYIYVPYKLKTKKSNTPDEIVDTNYHEIKDSKNILSANLKKVFEKNDSKVEIAKCSKNFNLVKDKVDYKKRVTNKYDLNSLNYFNDNLYFGFKANNNYELVITNEKIAPIKIYKNINEKIINNNFSLDKSFYSNNKLIQIFSKKEMNHSNQKKLIIAFYNS